MVKVRKFQGWLAQQSNVNKIISPPYDALNTEEAIEMSKGNEMSFLHVNKPEIDLPEGTDHYAPEVYSTGRENLDTFKKNGWLVQDGIERMYIYMQQMDGRKQYGIVAAASVDDYENDLIKKHEYTIKRKEQDRTRLIDEQSANVGPVFLTFEGGEDIQNRMMEIVETTEPYADVTADDGIGHALWLINEEQSNYFEKEFEKIPYTFIADGHHRTAASANVGKLRKETAVAEGHVVTGDEQFNYFMAIHYPANNLAILDYNRLLKGFNGLTEEQFLERVSESYDIEPITDKADIKPRQKFEHSLYLGKKWYHIKVKEDKINRSSPVSQLDTQLLTDLVLTPILGIEDLRTDKSIEFVGGIRGLGELEKRCEEDCVAAVALYPVQLSELMSIANAGLIMPPKSTWFEPKPRSGFVVRCFD